MASPIRTSNCELKEKTRLIFISRSNQITCFFLSSISNRSFLLTADDYQAVETGFTSQQEIQDQHQMAKFKSNL